MELVLKNGSSCDTLMADVRVWTAKSPEDGSSLVYIWAKHLAGSPQTAQS